MEQAKKLLRTESSITHICYSLGFDSLSSFTGLFKRLVNKTPSEYRHEQHRLKVEVQNTPLKFIPHCFAEKKGWLEKSNFEEAGR
ncbi:MAG: helix-turn-helix domain-containing protein [Bacteroidota bacterium]|nr:helix-turn-helix domain-containing protein [Bacteroidota bacterium]